MGRRRRSHLPGGVFHLTARTQGREPWFTPAIRTEVVAYVGSALRGTAADLLAFAIMPNHLHVVIRQGTAPLSRFMQPLLRRTSLLVQRVHGVEGHVFERQYRDHVCRDPDYVRNAIVYTHLNPVRAELVGDASEYAWSSHAAYATGAEGTRDSPAKIAVIEGLRLFAPGGDSDLDEMRETYTKYVVWRRQRDAAAAAEACGVIIGAAPRPPEVTGGDSCWSRLYAPLFCDRSAGNGEPPSHRACAIPDLGEIAARTLREIGNGARLEQIRSTFKGRAIVRIRHAMVRRMSAAGYSGSAIARYLRVSDQCVSAILRPPH